jgi:RHS repeat-associated protein
MRLMSAVLKLVPETEKLSQKPPLGEKRSKLQLVWENPKISAGTQKGKSEVKPNSSYGRVLYNYFRDYNPTTGRYIESDPIGIEGGLNTYFYAKANPTLNIDTDGHLAANALAASGGAVFGGAFGFFSEFVYQFGRCDSLRGIDWWSVFGATTLGAASGAITGATFGATTGINVGTGFVAGMALGNEAGMLRGLVEYEFNPNYPKTVCECEQ